MGKNLIKEPGKKLLKTDAVRKIMIYITIYNYDLQTQCGEKS